jgi:hypothetical protein
LGAFIARFERDTPESQVAFIEISGDQAIRLDGPLPVGKAAAPG